MFSLLLNFIQNKLFIWFEVLNYKGDSKELKLQN